METLEDASVGRNIVPFTKFLAELIKEINSGHRVKLRPLKNSESELSRIAGSHPQQQAFHLYPLSIWTILSAARA